MSANQYLSGAARLGCVAALALAGASAMADAWSTIGSAGTVDNDDVSQVYTSSGAAGILSTVAAPATGYIRYNLTERDGFSDTNKSMVWHVRFRDNGGGARVRLYLKQYTLDGSTVTKATFDSNNYSSSSVNQRQTICFTMDKWDFLKGPYYVEAELSKTDASGSPLFANTVLKVGPCPL